jgi:mannosyltransferase
VRTRHWLVLLTAAAAALRFSTLGVQSFWSDEGFTVEIVRHSFGGVFDAVQRTESTPPLYYYLGWLWGQAFGTSEVGLRSLSALLGTATVPVSYAAARELFSRRAGLLCAALVTFSPLLIWYSQEARAYALLAFLLTAGLWMFARVLRDDRRALWWWGAISALALATQYFAVFTVVPEAAWLLFTLTRAGERRVWPAAAIPVAMAAILVPLLIYQDHHVARPWTVGYTIKDAVTGVAQEGLVGPSWTPFIHRAGVAVTAILVIVGVLLLIRDRRRSDGLVPLVLLVASIGVPLAGAVVTTNYVVIRNVIFAVPLVFMLVSAGCAYHARSGLGTAVVAALSAIGLAIAIAVPLTPSLQRADWRDAIHMLASPPVPRVWIFLDRFQSTPISTVYLPHAHPLGDAITFASEVDIIGTPGYPGTTAAAPPGFTLASRQIYRGLSLSVFRAPRPVPVTATDFDGLDARVVTTGP